MHVKKRSGHGIDHLRPMIGTILVMVFFLLAILPSVALSGNHPVEQIVSDPAEAVVSTRGEVEDGWEEVYTAVIQYDTHDWNNLGDHDYGVDVERLDAQIRIAADWGAKLVVTPEIALGLEPRNNQQQIYEDTFAMFSGLADELDICLVGSFYEPKNDGSGNSYTTGFFWGPDGSLHGKHRKNTATPGCIEPFATPIGRVGILICSEIDNTKINTLLEKKIDLYISLYSAAITVREDREENVDDGPHCRLSMAGICHVSANHYHGNFSAMSTGNSGIYGRDGETLAFAPMEDGEITIFANIEVPKKKYAAVETSQGNFAFLLHKDFVPFTVENMTEAVAANYYEGLTIHHAEKGMMLRGGRFDIDMNTKVPVIPPLLYEKYVDYWGIGKAQSPKDGIVALYHPNGDLNTTSEFMIFDGDHMELNDTYTIIGEIVAGSSTIDRILDVPTTSRTGDDQQTYDKVPTDPVVIDSFRILNELPDFPPEYTGDLADTTVDEDTTWGLDLGTVFTDQETPGQLTFACSSPEMVMNGSTASWSPVHGDGDLLDVVFTATDGSSNSASSPGFNLLYQEVNDVPEYLGGLSDATVVEDDAWEVDLGDCFDDEESDDQLTFTCSSPEINITGTVASWSPVTEGQLIGVVFTAVDPELPNPTMSSPAIALTCTGVNDPPVIGPLDGITVMEDVPYKLDLNGKVSDEETDALSLTLTTDSDHVTVSGLSLTFLYGEGDTGEDVTVTVSDGELETSAVLGVAVTQVNDPPAIADLDDITVVEDEPFELDISDMVSDPDSALADLDVTTDSDNVEVDGLVLTFLYPDGVTGEDVEVVVSDGEFDVSTTLAVTVDGSNDPPEKPVVDGISDGWTYTDEDTFDIRVTAEDGDGDPVGVTITSSIDGDLGDGQGVSLSPGEHTITITATDPEGEVSTTVLSVKVVAAGSDDPDAGKDTGGDDITDGDGSGSGDDGAGADGTGAEGTGDGTGGEDGSSGDGSGSGWLLPAVLVAVAVVVAILLGAMYFMKGRGPGGVGPDGAPPVSPSKSFDQGGSTGLERGPPLNDQQRF